MKSKIELCGIFSSDPAKVQRVRERVEEVNEAVKIFKALADDTRCKLVYALSLEELCVCDLSNVFGLTVPAISYHLRILRDLNLVECRREGKVVFYTLVDEHIVNLLRETIAHLEEAGENEGSKCR